MLVPLCVLVLFRCLAPLSRSVCPILFWWHPVSCVLYRYVVLLPLSSYLIKMSAVLPPFGCSPIIPCASVLSVFPLLIAMSSLMVVCSLLCVFPFDSKVSFPCFCLTLFCTLYLSVYPSCFSVLLLGPSLPATQPRQLLLNLHIRWLIRFSSICLIPKCPI